MRGVNAPFFPRKSSFFEDRGQSLKIRFFFLIGWERDFGVRGRPWRALQGGHTLVSTSLLRPERMDVHETTPLADSSSPVNELPTVFQERLVKKTSNRIRRRRVCGAAALCGAALAVAGVASWKHSGQQARLVVADTRLSQFLQLEETRMVKERGRDTYLSLIHI